MKYYCIRQDSLNSILLKEGVIMFKRLIIATDVSEASYTLVKCLGGLRAYGAEECLLLQCLSAQETVSIALTYTTAVLEKNLQDLKEILEKQGYKVEAYTVPGLAKNEINWQVENNYSIIVVGAQEHSLTHEIFFGGLAYDVINSAQKPVLIIRMTNNHNDCLSFEGLSCMKTVGCDISNHILFPTDFSENADIAFSYVEKMVADGVKKVTLLHIQDKSRVSPRLEDRLDEFNKIDYARLENMKKILQVKGNVAIEILLKYGSPSAEILKLVRELNVQLVVMGSQGRGYVKELFLGSVSHNIARHSASSVLLIPAKRQD